VRERTREEALRGYVLGTLPEDEQAALDEELARDADGAFAELEAAEADLLDAHAAGELPAMERRQVEEVYTATPAGRRRLAFAAALRRRAASMAPRRRRTLRWLPLAAAIAAVAFLGALVAWRDRDLREEVARLERSRQEASRLAERLARTVEAGEAETSRLRAQLERALRETPAAVLPSPAVIASLVLRRGLLRDPGSVPTLELGPSVEWVDLELELPDDGYASYAVDLQTPDGRSLWRGQPVAAPVKDRRLAVRVPAAVFGDDTYVVILFGYAAGGDAEPAAEYALRARRRG
jgi:hypothetical protein